MGIPLIPPFVAMDGLGENVAKQIVRAREEGEFLSKTGAPEAWWVFRLPWLKRWMRWAFLAICQRITS